jgi:hypothetical protein
MKPCLIVCGAVALAGCVTSSVTYTADGRHGYTIECNGAVQSWSSCYQKAGELCGTSGYDILAGGAENSGLTTSDQYGLYSGAMIIRSMMIACR